MNIDAEEVRIFAGGFTNIRAEINDEHIFYYFINEPTHEIAAQVYISKCESIFDKPQKKISSVNTVNTILGVESVHVVRQMIKNHRSHNVRWMDGVEDGGVSIFVFLKPYSDKPQTNMNLNGLTFYPFEFNPMNMAAESGKLHFRTLKNILLISPKSITISVIRKTKSCLI